MSSSSFQDITQLIRVKEQELQEIHNLRCSQLEKMVDERDKIILDVAKKFESLRDDFSYNLSLLEARDEEIARLEAAVAEKTRSVSERDNSIRSLSQKVELLERKNSDISEKFDTDRKNSKRLLNELKDAIEALKWSAEENDRAKSHEIEKLKLELANFKRDKDESMELQRQDLISTFDSIILTKESALAMKEKDIADQVVILESRLESLLNENVKLKSSIVDTKRANEQLREDNLAKQDSIRQLNWKIEDEVKGKIVLEERLNSALQASKTETDSLKDSILKSDLAHKLAQEKLSNELDRLRDNFQSQSDFLSEYKKSSLANISRLELELLESQNREDRLRAEITNSLMSKDIENEKAASLKSHLDLVVNRFSKLERENAQYHNDNIQLKKQLIDANELMESKLKEISEAADERFRHSQVEFSKNLSIIQQAAAENNASFESFRQSEYEKIHTKFATEFAAKLKDLEDSKKSQIEGSTTVLMAEIDRLNQQLLLKSKELDDEKAEAAVIKVRLRVYEKGYASASQPSRLSSAHLESQQGGPERIIEVEKKDEISYYNNSHNDNNSNDNMLGSPMFSEDYGSVSIPNSPMISFANEKDNSFLMNGRESFRDSPVDINKQRENHSDANYQNSPKEDADESARIKELVDENKRLKAVIKEMRGDIESLQFQVVDNSKVVDIESPSGGDERVRSLERRLEQTIEEVARLRKERARLMDIGNELRAALYKKEIEVLDGGSVASQSGPTGGSAVSTGKSAARKSQPAWTEKFSVNKIVENLHSKMDGDNNNVDSTKDLNANNLVAIASQNSDSSAKENDLANSLHTKAVALSKFPSKVGRSGSITNNKLSVSGKAKQSQASAPRKVMNYATASKDTESDD